MNDLGAERLLEHANGLRALARRLVGADAADDVVQETFAAALRSPPDPDRPARPWLARVLRNVAKMRYRGDARRVLREDAVAVEPVTANDPAQIVERLEVHRAVCDILVALDEPYRTTLVLHYYDGLSLAEIARKDSVPEATVRWRHKQALDRLRARLDERSGGDRRAWMAALAPLAGARPVVMGGLLVKKLLVGLALLALVLLVGLKLIAGERVAAPRTTAAAKPVKLQFRAPQEPALLARSAQTASGKTTAGTLGATRIVGRVVDDQARPVANATVWLGEIRDKFARAALSGADGRFSIGSLRPGRFRLLASFGDLVSTPDEVALPFGKTREIELVVRPGKVELGGQIVDETGRGIANAAVDVRGAVTRTTRADGEGRFRVAGLVAGVYEVAASADDFVRAQVSKIVPHEGNADVTLKLARGVVVTGFVRTAAGTPVAGAAVGSTAWNLHDPRLDVESDARGQFRIGPLPSGSTRLSAFHPDHGVSEIATVELPPGSAPTVDLVFASSAAIEGSVRLDDGTPAAGAAITVTASDTPARWSVDADAAGHFALGSLPVGGYMISATSQPDAAPQAAPSATKRIKLAQGARERVELQIAGGSEHVRGRVVDEQGAPVAGAAVWVELASLTMSPTVLDDVHSYSGPDGAFDLQGLARGEYHVYAAHPDHATGRAADVRAGASDVTVALRAAASISGHALTADGKPLRSFHLQWKWRSRKGQYGEVFSMGGRMIEDPDGRFAIDGLEPTSLFMVSIETASGATGDATPFPLAEGERKTDLEIKTMGDGTVRGRVIDRNTGRPAIGLVVFFPSVSMNVNSPVDGNGRFEAQVPAGSYPHFHVQSETQGYPEVERAFVVKPGETTELGDVQIDLR